MSIDALSREMIVTIFQDQDLSSKDVARGHRVCKEWNELLGIPMIWNESRFNEAGLPKVEGIDTKLNVVFNNLFCRSLNYEWFKKWWGKVQDFGIMSKEAYDRFFTKNDPFIPSEGPQQKICETSWLVIDFSSVWRPYDETLFNRVNASTDLRDKAERSADGKEMKIPGTLRNRKLLIEHTHPGKRIFGLFHSEALAQCNDAPEKTGFWVVRGEVYQNKAYSVQEDLIKGNEGYKLVPLRVGVVFYSFILCRTGNCPLKAGQDVRFARTADLVHLQGGVSLPMAIGGEPFWFTCLAVGPNFHQAADFNSALAGFPAEE